MGRVVEGGFGLHEPQLHEPSGGVVDVHEQRAVRSSVLEPVVLAAVDLDQLAQALAAKAGLVRQNKIYNIGYHPIGYHPERKLYGSRGILIESRCHGYTAEGNEISKIGGSGIEIRNANDTQILHNTISDARLAGVSFKDGARAVIMDNIFSTSLGSGITIGRAAWQDGGHTIDYNFYDLVGRPGAIFGVTVPKTFVGWQQACHCEAHGRMGDLLAAPK